VHTAYSFSTHCNSLQSTATHCYALLHTATHCFTLLHTATHYNTLQQLTNTLQRTATHCNTLQHAAAHCNTLQHTAIHHNTCNTLQHMMVHPTKAVLSVVCACYTSIRRVVRASEAHEICMCIVCCSVLQCLALSCGCTHDTVNIHTTPSLCRMHIFTV